jgi:hypothetical protein
MNPRNLLGARVIDGLGRTSLNYKIGNMVDAEGFVTVYWDDGCVSRHGLNDDFLESMTYPTDTVILLSKTTILKQYFGLP